MVDKPTISTPTIDFADAEDLYRTICCKLESSSDIDRLIQDLDFPSFTVLHSVAALRAIHCKNAEEAAKLQEIADILNEEYTRIQKDKSARRIASTTNQLEIDEMRLEQQLQLRNIASTPLITDQTIIDNALQNNGEFLEKDIEKHDHVALQNLQTAIMFRTLSCKDPAQRKILEDLAKDAETKAENLKIEAGQVAMAEFLSNSRETRIGKNTAMEITALTPPTEKPVEERKGLFSWLKRLKSRK